MSTIRTRTRRRPRDQDMFLYYFRLKLIHTFIEQKPSVSYDTLTSCEKIWYDKYISVLFHTEQGEEN